ncbi:RNA polymerase sigma factor [Gaoshiqia sp. Z1-71]|uniref:RNA polymerase sigma factor n=1 Tax=Gaoshiqia hydrogeniformans TaxID=3290090 RepID=UPI003BF81359
MTGPKENTESNWVLALKKGDAQAFDAIFRMYGKRLYYFAWGYLKSKPEAEEVVQEVFLKIWKNREGLNPDLSFKAYLFKIAFNHIQELFLKLANERKYLNQLVESSVSFTNEMDERINYRSLLELVDGLIRQLPARQSRVFILRKKEGKSLNEIAEELNISPKTVENHITEAMKKIKEGLSDEHMAGLLFFFLFVKK